MRFYYVFIANIPAPPPNLPPARDARATLQLLQLTAHEVVDERVEGAVGVAQPMGQQGEGDGGLCLRQLHGVPATRPGQGRRRAGLE